MDQPQHQVFGTDNQSYRYMAYPFQRQELQLLYPGRLMKQDYHYTGENILNEDPDGLAKSQEQNSALAKAAQMELEALERHLGGSEKVVPFPAVEPEAPNEDPELSGLTIASDVMSGNLDQTLSKYDDLKEIEQEDNEIVHRVRRQLKHGSPSPLSREEILPQYDWQAAGVGYDGIQNNIIETFSPLYSAPKKSSGMVIWSSIGGVMIILLIVILIYGIYALEK